MATFNPDQIFFEEQVASLLAQTHQAWVCIVVDDCSEESKFRQIEAVVLKEDRFILYRNTENKGSFLTFEEGLKRIPAGVDFVALCDQDDIWMSDKLEKMLEVFKDSQVSLVHSDLELIDKDGKTISSSCWQKEGRYVPTASTELILFRNVVTGCACMFRAGILKSALPFPQRRWGNEAFYYHDAWIALHASLYGQIQALSLPLVKYRQHEGNQVGGGRTGKGLEIHSLKERAAFAYESRRQLADDFVQSCAGARQLKFRILSGLMFSVRHPAFFKTWGLVVLGALLNFSKKRPS